MDEARLDAVDRSHAHVGRREARIAAGLGLGGLVEQGDGGGEAFAFASSAAASAAERPAAPWPTTMMCFIETAHAAGTGGELPSPRLRGGSRVRRFQEPRSSREVSPATAPCAASTSPQAGRGRPSMPRDVRTTSPAIATGGHGPAYGATAASPWHSVTRLVVFIGSSE